MTDRSPALQHRRVGDELTPQLPREHQLARFPMLRGVWVDVTFAANATTASALHKLGRRYVGATSVMQKTAVAATSALSGLVLRSPDIASAVADPDERVVFARENPGGTAETVTIRAWVF